MCVCEQSITSLVGLSGVRLMLFSQWKASTAVILTSRQSLTGREEGFVLALSLTTVCFVSWIAALHREFHQLLDLMDLTLTQGLRLSQRKILKRFDSVCNLIRGACLGNPVDFHWRRNSSRFKGPEYYWDLGEVFGFTIFNMVYFLEKMLQILESTEIQVHLM